MNLSRLFPFLSVLALLATGALLWLVLEGNDALSDRITRIERQPIHRCGDACRKQITKRLRDHSRRSNDTVSDMKGGGRSSGGNPGSQPSPSPPGGGGNPVPPGTDNPNPPPTPPNPPAQQQPSGPLRPALDNLNDTVQGTVDSTCETAGALGVPAC